VTNVSTGDPLTVSLTGAAMLALAILAAAAPALRATRIDPVTILKSS
jgi:ABC-type antimicrobial peptide transport system permease subunit